MPALLLLLLPACERDCPDGYALSEEKICIEQAPECLRDQPLVRNDDGELECGPPVGCDLLCAQLVGVCALAAYPSNDSCMQGCEWSAQQGAQVVGSRIHLWITDYYPELDQQAVGYFIFDPSVEAYP